jgi:conjugal transfer pilus assembly protein TraK
MKKQFFASLVASACLSTFAQTASVAAVESSAAVTQVKEDASTSPVVVPRKGSIVIPSKKVAPIVMRSDESAASGVINLPVPRTAKSVSQELPGLGLTPGLVAAENRVKSIRVGSDRNELVYISQTQLNKIATPFADPKAVDASGATLRALGQDLFVKLASDQPVTIYITDGGVGQSVGLTLVPKANLPAQSIVIEPEAATTKNLPPQGAEELLPSDYVGRLTSHIKQLALGKTPAGFVKSRLQRTTATNPQMMFEAQNKFVGSTYDIFSYRLTSIAASPVELSEEAFYTPNVRAVAFYPSAMLQKGESTLVYVIAEHVGSAK